MVQILRGEELPKKTAAEMKSEQVDLTMEGDPMKDDLPEKKGDDATAESDFESKEEDLKAVEKETARDEDPPQIEK